MAWPLERLLERLARPQAPPVLMGVLNLTPDSFSDGGRFLEPAAACRQALALVEAGAEILDLGAESTRPGAQPVPPAEQLRRLEPLLSALPAHLPAWLSIDTRLREPAALAARHGAVLVNDISAGRGDPELWPWLVEEGLATVLMHMQGEPDHMQDAPAYAEVMGEVEGFLRERARLLIQAGLPASRILLDPGIGFGKRLEDNLALLAGLDRLARLGHPVLLGASRKRLIPQLEEKAGRPPSGPEERLGGSLALALWAARRGARVLRVHDVAETRQLLDVWNALEGRWN